MKSGIFALAAVALLQLTAAEPHGLRQKHRHHQRQAQVEQIDYVIEEYIVYVDDQGNPVSTGVTVVAADPPTSTATPTSAAPSTTPTTFATSTSPATSSTPPPATSSAPAPVVQVVSTPAATSTPAAPPPAPAPAPQKDAAQGPGFGSAIAYSPYNSDGTCRTASQVASDIALLGAYQVIRLYNPDCNQIANVLAAIKGTSKQIFAGCLGEDSGNNWDPSSLASEVQSLISQVNGNWGQINTVNIGNELVNAGKTSAGAVEAAVGQYRSVLRAAGYQGPVVTVDTMVAMRANIGLCTASDYCAINCHPFYDGNTLPQNAGPFVLNWVQQISALAGGKQTVVTESGWPTQGPSIGKAVASQQNMETAISSLTSTFSNNLIQYNAFDNLWLGDPGLTHWGILGAIP